MAVITEEVIKKQKICEEDLIKTMPALKAAQAALNTLNKANLTELKSFGAPPDAVTNVTAAVVVLFSPGGKVPKDRSWKAAKVIMNKHLDLCSMEQLLFLLLRVIIVFIINK